MSAPPDSERLFFALWPPEAVRTRLEAAARALLPPGMRPVPRNNLHLTVAFIGNVARGPRDCLEQCAGTATVARFELRLDCSGWFRRSQVIWLGTRRCPQPLLALAAALRRCQEHCGLTPEARAFAPHVTLARRARRPPLRRPVAPLDWPVDEFALVLSEKGAPGRPYRVLRRWPLAGGVATPPG